MSSAHKASPQRAERTKRKHRSNSNSTSQSNSVSTSSDDDDDTDNLNSLNNERAHQERTKKTTTDEAAARLIWSDEDDEDVGAVAYKRFKNKKSKTRSRAAALTRRAKALDAGNYSTVNKIDEGHTGVGRNATRKRKKRPISARNRITSDDESIDNRMPEYVKARRDRFNERTKQLKKAGLMLPPSYDSTFFSDDESIEALEEKPNFAHIKPVASYGDVELSYSLGVIPASIAQYLREYQRKGAEFLHELFVYQKGGILGDDMGLGKTVQVIAFMTAAYGKTADERDKKRMRKMRRKGAWYPRTLIICPGSLMANWQDEFQRWGWWHTDLFHGSNHHRDDVLDTARSGMLEVMITTYTTYRIHKSAINTIAWDCVVADECHIIKERRSEITKSMNEVNALCRIGLTGTAIQNKYEELWTLLNWTSPGILGPVSTWKVSISEPLKLGQSHDATVYELARARKTAKMLVENLLPQFFLRRLKSLIKDQLPKKTDQVVFCPLTTTQAKAYQNFLDSDIVQTIKDSSIICDCGSGKKRGWCCYMHLENGDMWQSWVFPAITYLQRMSNHLALLIPQGTDPKEKQSKDLELLQIAFPNQWEQLYTTRDSIINYSNPEFCGKWRVLKKLLKFWYEAGDNKVLVFSHNVRLLKMLQALLVSTSYNVKYLDGSMSYDDRYTTVRDFNTDPTQFIFLISTRAGGVGLNITSANKVVVIDPNWNPSYDLQAQDRAYRIGQTRDVEVFRLVSQGTLEEIVYARQIYKQQQASIGYSASSERRYFQGVQDRKDQKGEIFGLQNLFAYQDENIVLRDIVHKTNVAESKADVKIASLKLEEEDETLQSDDAHSDDENSRRNPQTSTREDEAISQLAAEIIGTSSVKPHRKTKSDQDTLSSLTSTNPMTARSDPVQAILASTGVSYTHENSEVVGSSRVEAALSKRAEHASASISQQKAKVFTHESQSQQGHHGVLQEENPGDSDPEEHRYKYRPPEEVKRRQFCSMARWAGYGDNVTEFALVVESCTQAQRRELLEGFYAWRRRFLTGEITDEDKEDGTGRKDVKTEHDPSTEEGRSITNDKDSRSGPAMLQSDDEDDEL